MNYEIRPSLGEPVSYKDGEIDGIILWQNGERYLVPYEQYLGYIRGSKDTIEYLDVGKSYRIRNVYKEKNILEIGLDE